MVKKYFRLGEKLIVHTDGELYDTRSGVLNNAFFREALDFLIDDLLSHGAPLLREMDLELQSSEGRARLTQLLQALCHDKLEDAVRCIPNTSHLLQSTKREALHEFVERLYNYWRSFERFVVLRTDAGLTGVDAHTSRLFNDTLEKLKHLTRSVYRDLCENVTGVHPRVYRQVAAGANVGLIVTPKTNVFPDIYENSLGPIEMIRQVLVEPPMLIDPPMNKRSGAFVKVERNPLEGLTLDSEEWLCYPAQVGPLVVFTYFHNRFIDLGCSLANLFELADDEQITKGPDAVFVYGVPTEQMEPFGEERTVFYEDEEHDLLVGAIPGEKRFGYFGYLKKMMLTLHNVAMMKRGRMPFHGAMVRIFLRSGSAATLLIIGDTATGKSETLEALRQVGEKRLSDMKVIADDMGSLEVDAQGNVLGYGTEIGAFVRLDDLQPGFAFGQLDRVIIMSPQKTNARVVLPITTLAEILRGQRIDFLLYANNHEDVDAQHAVVERFENAERALSVFREGKAMTKGTTTSQGLVRNYFANIFGPVQYQHLHEQLAERVFQTAFDQGVYVGQLRTRLGLVGYETEGPKAAAEALLALIQSGASIQGG